MVDCKIGRLFTEFTPERITLTVELVPTGDILFDEPMDNAASKLDAVANYARATFGVRTSKIDDKEGSSVASVMPPNKKQREEMKKEPIEKKLIAKGNERVIKVMEQDLARAKAEKNPVMIKRAEEALMRSKDSMERQAKDREEG